QSGSDPMDQLTEAIADKPGLLVLDNFEQIAAGSGIVERLLSQASRLRCLVTSRRRLGIAGERVMEVTPLGLPNGSKAPEDLIKYPSVQLFIDRAQAARPDFQITTGNAGAIADLCRSLEGIPLAIELAAARAQSLTPAQMVERLSEKFASLLSARRDDREAR